MKDSIQLAGYVSVIVPCYNIEKYVERCISSILSQTYRKIEVLAIDDGSTDCTGKILDSLAKTDERLRVFHYANGGLSAARNRGFSVMRGQYVTCVDGDDFVDKIMLETMVQKAMETGSELVLCNHNMYYGSEKIVNANPSLEDSNMDSSEAIAKLFESDSHFVTAWAKLYKSELWENLKYPEDVRFGEDMFLAHILFDRAERICFISKPLYYYNQEGESLVRSKFNRNKLQMITAAHNWVTFCQNKYPELVVSAEEYYYSILINMCTYLTIGEYAKDYEEIRREIRKHKIQILKSHLSKKDKIKCRMIVLLNYRGYGRARKLLVNKSQ